jgi:sugar lactone lactonase YvrE
LATDYNDSSIKKMSPEGDLTVFAGGTDDGLVDGTGTAAQFFSPGGLALGINGNLYVADTDNNAIRKITPTGVVTTLAGGSGSGFLNGTGTAAKFHSPSDITADSTGNCYLTDKDNHAIRKLTPEGLVTTMAGSGTSGFANGTGTSAAFSYPSSITINNTNVLYVSDSWNNAIRKITPEGAVTTLAGGNGIGFTDGSGTAATFSSPDGIAIDSTGNLFVADYDNNAIRKITPAGEVTTVVGQAGKFGFQAGYLPGVINHPSKIAIVGDSLYISQNGGIARVTPLP